MSTTVLTIARGETKTFRVYVKNPDGTAKDLTGMTAALVVKQHPADGDDVLLELEGVILDEGDIDPTDGVIEFYAIPASTEDLDPKNYSVDVWVMNGGDRWQVLGPAAFRVTARVKSSFA